MNIIVAGIMGRHPYGGVAWCSLMYLLGLRRLGHEVWYLEDTAECNFDPVENTLAMDPRYALGFINACLTPYELGDRWCYVDHRGCHHGYSRGQWLNVCDRADLFLNLSGGSWNWRDEYLRIPRSAFIDSDPAFTQLDIALRGEAHRRYFVPFDALFTFGRNIGTPACTVPVGSLQWRHTWQPVCLEEWQPTHRPPRRCFTTVMSWRIHSFADIGGNKDEELTRLLHLPSRVDVPLELAVGASAGADVHALLRPHGWRCRDAFSVSHDLDSYRDYIRSSRGELSVCKRTYAATNSGWFSDRTECYLASGRPAVVQDTGFSAHLPTGEGLLAFRTADEARAGLEAVLADYEHHSRAARELAAEHFAAPAVLRPLLDRVLSP